MAAVIRMECGVSSHPAHISRVCQAMRWSPQKPARRARQRDEAAITHWRDETWPALNKGRKRRNTRSSSETNQASIPLPSVVRTYAPVGQTPILREWRTRDHLAAISAISPEGTLSCHCQDHAIHSADVVAFLEHLLREVPGRIRIIWDGSPIHRSRVIKKFLAHGAAQRLHLERLPAYAPELNPDEGMWQRLKGVELRNLCCVNLRHLRTELQNAVKRVRRKPRIIHACCAGTRL